MNFLYCFDNNYNVQGAVSIYSLLNNLDEKITIYIIHNNPKSFAKYKRKISQHKNLNEINIYKFNEIGHNFPNLLDSHVTSATYFRIFIQKYLPSDIDYLSYIDADVICMENPTGILLDIKQKMIKQKLPIAALTELTRNNAASFFENLGMKNDKYFNAGVLVIDYQQWIDTETIKTMLEIMKKNYKKIIFWDQDVMNLYFDSNYLEIPSSMNYTSPDGITITEEKIYFHHYAGSKKPWYFENIYSELSSNYQNAYKNFFKNSYHVNIKLKRHEISSLLNIFKSSSIPLNQKLKFLYGAFKTLIIL